MVNGDPRYGTSKKINVLRNKSIIEPPVRIRPTTRRTTSTPTPSINILPIKPSTDPVGVEPTPDPTPEVVKAPFISDKDFELKIIQLSEKKASINDFSAYLCGNLQLSITANRKRISFSDFCDKIRRKGVKMRQLKLYRNEVDGCIKNIELKYRPLRL